MPSLSLSTTDLSLKFLLFAFQEVITAGHFQNLYPNTTSLSASGRHGSKFVTVLVTGSGDNQVHMEGYQVGDLLKPLHLIFKLVFPQGN